MRLFLAFQSKKDLLRVPWLDGCIACVEQVMRPHLCSFFSHATVPSASVHLDLWKLSLLQMKQISILMHLYNSIYEFKKKSLSVWTETNRYLSVGRQKMIHPRTTKKNSALEPSCHPPDLPRCLSYGFWLLSRLQICMKSMKTSITNVKYPLHVVYQWWFELN